MKHLFLFLSVFFILSASAQPPQAIPYQAVARGSAGDIISNQTVSLRFSIHDGSANGTVVYSETQSATTNGLGLFTVNIGQGTVVIGSLSGINWGNGAKFMQIEMDVMGGANYVDIGTQQMMSVPYALHANTSNDAATFKSGTGSLAQFGTTTIPHGLGRLPKKVKITALTIVNNFIDQSIGTYNVVDNVTSTIYWRNTSPIDIGVDNDKIITGGNSGATITVNTTDIILTRVGGVNPFPFMWEVE